MLHYVMLRYVTLRYVTLHVCYVTLRYVRYVTLHYVITQRNTELALPFHACVLTLGIPVVATMSPGYICIETCKHIEEAVSNQHVVIDAGNEGNQEHCPTNT